MNKEKEQGDSIDRWGILRNKLRDALKERDEAHGLVMRQDAELATLRTRLEALEEWGQRMAYYLDWLIDLYPAEKLRAEAMKVQARILGLVEE